MITFNVYCKKKSPINYVTFRNLFLIIMVVLCSFSCNNIVEAGLDKVENRSGSNFDFSIYGVKHNDMLDYVTTLTGFDTISRQAVFNYGNTYSNDGFSSSLGSWTEHDDSYVLIFYLIDNPTEACDTLYSLGMISNSEINLCGRLIAILQQYTDPVDIVDAFDGLIEHIDTSYTIVYDEETKTGNFAARFKALSEIGKASIQYWYEVETNYNHPWNYRYQNMITTNVKGNSTGSRGWRWLKVAWADVKGFVTAGNCGNANAPGGYDLGCAWDHAGDMSDSVP